MGPLDDSDIKLSVVRHAQSYSGDLGELSKWLSLYKVASLTDAPLPFLLPPFLLSLDFTCTESHSCECLPWPHISSLFIDQETGAQRGEGFSSKFEGRYVVGSRLNYSEGH